MDLIGALPEVFLPHLCSFFAVEVNEVMVLVSRRWKYIAETYGCLGITFVAFVYFPFLYIIFFLLNCYLMFTFRVQDVAELVHE